MKYHYAVLASLVVSACGNERDGDTWELDTVDGASEELTASCGASYQNTVIYPPGPLATNQDHAAMAQEFCQAKCGPAATAGAIQMTSARFGSQFRFTYSATCSGTGHSPGGNGWQAIPSAGLPTGTYSFLYYQPQTGNWFRSPRVTKAWSWTTFNSAPGVYAWGTNNAFAPEAGFSCSGVEAGTWGVGCSNGPGSTAKTLTIYNSSPATSSGTVCQDSPNIFGAVCQTVQLYYRAETSVSSTNPTAEVVSGGGWQPLPATGLPSANYQFLYYYPNGTWSRSPRVTSAWSWSSFSNQPGTYNGGGVNAGFATSLMPCSGAELGSYGVGCSNGGGATKKVLTIYGNSPSTSTGTVCQSSGCTGNVQLYYKNVP